MYDISEYLINLTLLNNCIEQMKASKNILPILVSQHLILRILNWEYILKSLSGKGG